VLSACLLETLMPDNRYRIHVARRCNPAECRWCDEERRIAAAHEDYHTRRWHELREELRRLTTGDSA
jgi:hypothetical protein